MDITTLFSAFQDATDVFTVSDVIFTTILSFLLSLIIAWVYKITYKGVSYTQSYVHTLIMMSMVVAIIMLVIGSNIARAFSLVGALSIIRFRNAVKDTRDVGYIFFAMAIGMARSFNALSEAIRISRPAFSFAIRASRNPRNGSQPIFGKKL